MELPDDVRDLLASLARQLAELIDDPEAADEPGLERLFPPASIDDPMEALGFEQLMGDALRAGKREAAADRCARPRTRRTSTPRRRSRGCAASTTSASWSARVCDIQEDTDIEALFEDELMEQAARDLRRAHRAGRDARRAPPTRPSGPASRPVWIFSMFVVVRPAGDEAAITTASPTVGEPVRLQTLVHQRDHAVGVGRRRRRAAPRHPTAGTWCGGRPRGGTNA